MHLHKIPEISECIAKTNSIEYVIGCSAMTNINHSLSLSRIVTTASDGEPVVVPSVALPIATVKS